MKRMIKKAAKLLAVSLITAVFAIPVYAEPGNTVPTEGNLLKNGNAETGDMTGWKHDYTGFDHLYEAKKDSDFWAYTNVAGPHSGNYQFVADDFLSCYQNHTWQLSPQLVFNGEDKDVSKTVLYQDVDVTKLPEGTELVLRGYVGGEGFIELAVYDKDKNELMAAPAKDRSIKDKTYWKYQRLAFKLPKGAASVRVMLCAKFGRFYDGYGDPYGEHMRSCFDDVTLTEKKASSYVPAKAPEEGQILVNGGAENGNLDGWFYEYEDFVVFNATGKSNFFSRSDVTPHSGSYLISSDLYIDNYSDQDNSGGAYYLADDLSFSTDKPDDSTVTIYQDVDISSLAAGTKLTLDGYCAQNGTITLSFIGSDGKVISTSQAADKGDEKDGWQEKELIVTVPSDAALVRVNLNAEYSRFPNGYGNPYGEYTRSAFDDITLTIVKEDVTTDDKTTDDKTTDDKTTDDKDTKTETTVKSANPMKLTITKKTFSRKKHLKKKKTFNIGVKKAKGTVTYTLSAKAKKAKISVTKKGKVTVPKKCAKGTYTITVKAKGNSKFKSAKKTVKIIVKA